MVVPGDYVKAHESRDLFLFVYPEKVGKPSQETLKHCNVNPYFHNAFVRLASNALELYSRSSENGLPFFWSDPSGHGLTPLNIAGAIDGLISGKLEMPDFVEDHFVLEGVTPWDRDYALEPDLEGAHRVDIAFFRSGVRCLLALDPLSDNLEQVVGFLGSQLGWNVQRYDF